MPHPKDYGGPIDRVAAVCYRYADGSVQFILVHTGTGRWTFPKGHIEKGESPWAAAQREALEEAGLGGSIETEPFAVFPHEKRTPDGRRMELTVAAYLLHVESESGTPEQGREPTWFGPQEAKRRLAEGRSPRHHQAYFDVIGEACRKLGRQGSRDKPEER
jgi:8-oxo-dGTP pyrophosphatase MutT (NUDIX family)